MIWLRGLIAVVCMGTGLALAAPPSVRRSPQPVVAPLSAGQTGQVIDLQRINALPTHERIGVVQRGFMCGSDEALVFNERLAPTVLQSLGPTFRREVEAVGFPRYRPSSFPDATGAGSVEYQMAATLTGIELSFCGSGVEMQGGVWLQLEWEMYSPRERAVLYRTTLEGGAHTLGKDMSVTELYRMATTNAVRNLLADPKFLAQATRAAGAARDSAVSAAPVLNLTLAAATGTGDGAGGWQDKLPQLQSAVATVFSGLGSGSAFFISAEGHLLTNQHVVGDSKYVKVKLPTGRELQAEVLRADGGRDVALLKVSAVALAPLAVAAVVPASGSEVFALGSPFGDTFQASVARGVVGGIREIEGRRWLQSDVSLQPGSSGGPLVDARGHVVGIASRGTLGLNLFVPIADALTVLGIAARAP